MVGGAEAVEELQSDLLSMTREQISTKCSSFLMGLLTARESERVGAGGFYQIQTHPWFRMEPAMDWGKVLRREVIAPWVPDHTDGNNASRVYDFTTEKVRLQVAIGVSIGTRRLHAYTFDMHCAYQPRTSCIHSTHAIAPLLTHREWVNANLYRADAAHLVRNIGS